MQSVCVLRCSYAHSLHAGASVRAWGDGEAETNRDEWHAHSHTHTCGFNLRNQEMCDMFCACERVKHNVCVFPLGLCACVFECVWVCVCACACGHQVPAVTAHPRSEAIAMPLAWRRLRQRVRLLPWQRSMPRRGVEGHCCSLCPLFCLLYTSSCVREIEKDVW